MTYKITQKNINEDNILKFIEERSDKSYLDIYSELKNIVTERKKENSFDSLSSNYNPIFLFHLMTKKISTKDFNAILKISDYEQGLNRFFEAADCDYNESLDDCSYWDKMSWFFYTQKDDKVHYDKDKLPYIKSILENVHEKNLLDFHSSRIDFFLSHVFFRDPQSFSVFWEVMEKTPVLLKEKNKEYHNLPTNIVNYFSDMSYDKDVSEYYNIFKNNQFIKKIIDNNLINLDYHGTSLCLKLSLFHMLVTNEEPSSFIDYLNNLFNAKVEEFSTIKKEECLFNLSSSIYVGLEKINFEFDTSKIDTSKSWKENYIYLSVLSDLLSDKKFDKIKHTNKKLLNYLLDFDYDFISSKLAEKIISNEDFILRIRAFKMNPFENLDKVVFYHSLNDEVLEKNNDIKKFKM